MKKFQTDWKDQCFGLFDDKIVTVGDAFLPLRMVYTKCSIPDYTLWSGTGVAHGGMIALLLDEVSHGR